MEGAVGSHYPSSSKAGQFKGAPAMRQHWCMAQRFGVPVWWSYGATSP
ncbi:hypothetical protein HaLaN_19333, partial [Haematococcus lacustris]